MNEQQAHIIYDMILHKIIEPIIGKDITYGNDLNDTCKTMFGKRFHGVYPSNKIPNLNNNQYAIINLDRSDQTGSHWVAIVNNNGKYLVYDSFGRTHVKILPQLNYITKNIINSDQDAEQKINEDNCGGRSVSWLLFHYIYGSKNALLI